MKKLIYNETTDTTFAPYDEENFNSDEDENLPC